MCCLPYCVPVWLAFRHPAKTEGGPKKLVVKLH